MADSQIKPSKHEVIMHTENPTHECNFKWIIENVSKFSRRLRSSFVVESECKPEFQLVAKFHERYPEIIQVNVGVQRSDKGDKSVYVKANISLQSINGDIYGKTDFVFTSAADESPHYCFSDTFASKSKKLKVPTSFSYDSKKVLSPLEKMGLVASHEECENIFLMPDDMLVIKGVLKVYGCCVVTNKFSKSLQKAPPQPHIEQLLGDFRSSYADSLFTDVELVIGSEVINAHRFVLSSRSPVFRRMFEHDMAEKEDGKIVIEDLDKPVVEALVWYLYTGTVKDLSFEDTCDLYAAADKYEVFSLREACASVLTSRIDESTACIVLGMADLHKDDALKSKAKDYIVKNFHHFRLESELSVWKVLVKSNPGLAAEVVQEVTQRQWEKDNKKYVPIQLNNETSILPRHVSTLHHEYD
ncbi:hypothetical protein JTE90_008031 [Oedothorax gibbosus]|uniref:BTB domain-containing protein n=1 Tax=Oedothorax gibbosus TaxID=931172 RepID=A0AAV6UVY7_9ARAC|nr:hypothetical protein JTE90_008031 [Oedothorax gibbosus]